MIQYYTETVMKKSENPSPQTFGSHCTVQHRFLLFTNSQMNAAKVVRTWVIIIAALTPYSISVTCQVSCQTVTLSMSAIMS